MSKSSPVERLTAADASNVWPVTQIQGNVRLGVSAFSYAGRLRCAVHVDADVLDVAQLSRSLNDELANIAHLV